MTDAVKRSLAEMENVRMRTSRDVENAKKFGIQVSTRACRAAVPCANFHLHSCSLRLSAEIAAHVDESTGCVALGCGC